MSSVVPSPAPSPAPSTTPSTTPRTREVRSAALRVALAGAWVVVGLLGLVVLAAVVVPRVTGAQTYTILSGSMEPALDVGDVAVVRPTAFADIAIGDVVTYQVESGRDVTVTHRVVGVAVGPAGERRLLTQGDANDAADPLPVRAVQVRGTLWYAVPLVGRLVAAVDPDVRATGTRTLAGLLLAYAAAVLLGGLRRRPTRPEPPEGRP